MAAMSQERLRGVSYEEKAVACRKLEDAYYSP
jgi:hypothetical protein